MDMYICTLVIIGAVLWENQAWGYKTFFMLNLNERKISTAHNNGSFSL